jgi:fibronectin-binding autotransporter adhesin
LVRPKLERLEDRLAPTAYVVNDLGDLGRGAGPNEDLRYCITDAESHTDLSTITFSAALGSGTVELGQSLPTINSQITSITGLGANNLTVQRSAAAAFDFPVFKVGANAAVTISGMTISGGSGNRGDGGGVYNEGSLTLTNCVVSNNSVKASLARGGGIYNGVLGTLTLNGTTVKMNRALKAGGATDQAFGGGVLNYGVLLVQNRSAINLNNSDGDGGGIRNGPGGRISISQSEVSGNQAKGNGAGIANDSQATAQTPYTLTIRSSTLWNNTALGAGLGGGLYNNGGAYLSNSTFEGNTASKGGGIYATAGTTTKLTNVTDAGNNAVPVQQPPGPLTGPPSDPATGGGLYVEAGAEVDVVNTIIATNNAALAPDVYGTVSSQGTNLIGITDGSSGWVSSDLTGTSSNPLDPLLNPLADYGGPTLTMTLQANSPARQRGNINAVDSDTDQRGYARIVNGYTDIGAVEMQPGE